MRSITVHDIDTELDKRLTRKAREAGLSLNKTIKGILAEYLGIKRGKPDYTDDFSEFCGVWKKSDTERFTKRVQEFDRIDEGDWE